MMCNNCKKAKKDQLSIDLFNYFDNMNILKPLQSKILFNNNFKLFKKNYKNYPLIIIPKFKKKEFLHHHLIIGQERLMLYNIFKTVNYKNFNCLITTCCWCFDTNLKDECFNNIYNLIWHLQPKCVILFDNKDKILEKKFKKFCSQNKILYYLLIHPKKLIQHGGAWHPKYLNQIQTWKNIKNIYEN